MEDLDYWRRAIDESRSDPEWVAALKAESARREEIAPQLVAYLDEFLTGQVDIEALREVFDTRTRTEWDIFGLKGLSGAMFLNTLVKHLPTRRAEVTEHLRHLLPLPVSVEAGREKMQDFFDWLSDATAQDGVTGRHIQSSRLGFFASSLWHLRDRERWPVYYPSIRSVLEKRSQFTRTKNDPVESYFQFRAVFVGLMNTLNIGAWELERVCLRIEGKLKPPKPADSSASTQEKGEASRRTWLYSPGIQAAGWPEYKEKGIAAIGWDDLGDLRQYDSLDAIKDALRAQNPGGPEPMNTAFGCWQFANDMQPGDEIFAKKGRHKIVGYGIVEGDYEHDPTRPKRKNVRRVKWLAAGEWKPREKALVMKTLTDVSKYPQLVRDLRACVTLDQEDAAAETMGAEDEAAAEVEAPPYRLSEAVADLFVDRASIEEALALLKAKKNLVLQGPPGVGKTFVAKRLAYLLIGAKSPEHVCTVQFHQSYAYEDFVQGYRPSESGGFARLDGPFLRFADRALQDDAPHVLIIDEINRGNLSKVFGELLMLIEHDKRDASWATTLAYSHDEEEPFYVPPNLYIIGTMNTADRSLALVDYALRRRFAFVDVAPEFESATFSSHLAKLGADADLQTAVVERLTRLNALIASDKDLGPGFCVGHSYFCHAEPSADDVWFERVIRTEIEPLLREYWFDDLDKVTEAVGALLADE